MSRTERVLKASFDGGCRSLKAHERQLVKLGDFDALPFSTSMQRRFRWRNTSTYSCSYIHRYMDANCGRPWDDVYSELCAKFDSSTFEGHSARETIFYYVSPRRWLSYWRMFYVDDSGLLQKRVNDWSKKKRRARWNEPVDNQITIDSYSDYRKLNGIWYQVFYKDIPQGYMTPEYKFSSGTVIKSYFVPANYYDVVNEKHNWTSCNDGRYAWKKVQLGKHKLKELKVRND